MDGSGLAFLRDPSSLSGLADNVAGGILYFEDFDLEPTAPASDQAHAAEAPSAPILTSEDLEAARSQGFEEGMRAALADATLVRSQLQDAALQGLSDALCSARSSLERLARQAADEGTHAVLAMLQAAIPATMARHAAGEVDAVLRTLLPYLACLPELRVRVHPQLADHVRESLAGLAALDGMLLCVAADPTLQAGDLHVAWQDGGAQRDCTAIWNAIRAALARLELPALEEVYRGPGC